MDSAGPMARTPCDLAALLEVLRDDNHRGDTESLHTCALEGTWAGLSIGALDYKEWIYPPDWLKPEESATAQMASIQFSTLV